MKGCDAGTDLEGVCTVWFLVQVLGRVADCNAARVSLVADMADDSQRIKVSTACPLLLSFCYPPVFGAGAGDPR